MAQKATWSRSSLRTLLSIRTICSETSSPHPVAAFAERRRSSHPACAGLQSAGSRLPASILNCCARLPEILRSEQAVFSRTGGLHAAAFLTPADSLMALREDIGRHNAVDKIVGWALLEGICRSHGTYCWSAAGADSRLSQKALAAGIPVLASVSAPSSLAVKLARELGLTLIGFLRGRRFVVYSGEFRCIPPRAGQATI